MIKKSWMKNPFLPLLVLTLAPFIMKLINQKSFGLNQVSLWVVDKR